MESQQTHAAFTLRNALSLRANVAWTLAGNIVYALAQWGMLAAISKIGTAFMVGQFALGLAVSAPIYMFTNMQLRTIQATDARGEYAFAEYFALRLIASIMGLGTILLIAAFNHSARQTVLVIMAIATAKGFESVSDVIYGLCQKHEHMQFIAISMMMKGIGSVAALVIVLRITHSVFEASCAMAALWLLVLLVFDLHWAKRLLRWEPAHPRKWIPDLRHGGVRKLCILALPLGLQTMLASLTVNIPRYLVAHYLGTATLGIYAAMAYFIVAGHTVIAAVGNSVQARVSRYWYSSLPAFRKLLLQCASFALGIGLVGSLIAAVAGKRILTLFYRPEYATHIGVFETLMVAAGFYYVGSILNPGVAAARKLWVYTLAYLIVPIMALACSVVLIPHDGLSGAAIATLAYCFGNAAIPAFVLVSAYRDASSVRSRATLANETA
jgi:O-antigen/teichoic acid export membrane protein